MTDNLIFYVLDLEDDQSPVFTAAQTHAASFSIKDIPYTVRREKITIDCTGLDVITWNYCIIESSHPAPFKYRVFKIIDMIQKSISDRISVTFDIFLDAFATASYAGMTSVSGSIIRSPYNKTNQPFIPRPDQMKYSREVKLPELPVIQDHQTYMVKVTGILESNSPWVTGSPNLTAGSYLTVFIFVDDMSRAVTLGGSPSDVYPYLIDIVNTPETCTPFTSAEDIVDISISIRANDEIQYSSAFLYPAIKLKNASNATVSGEHWDGSPETFTLQYFSLGLNTKISHEWTEDLNIVLSENERMMSQLILRDAYGTTLGSIDTRYGSYVGDDWTIPIKVRTRDTYSNIQTTVVLPDDSEFSIVEGHLPYNSSAYAAYQVAQQQYDRETMRIQQDRSNLQIWQNAASSIASASETLVISGLGSLVGLAAGLAVGIAGWNTEKQLSEQEQRIKENQMKATPDSAYNAAYGVDYIGQCLHDKHDCIAISMPATITSGELTNYITKFGYVCNDMIGTINISGSPTEGCMIVKSATAALTGALNAKWKTSLFARWFKEQLSLGVRYKKV